VIYIVPKSQKESRCIGKGLRRNRQTESSVSSEGTRMKKVFEMFEIAEH